METTVAAPRQPALYTMDGSEPFTLSEFIAANQDFDQDELRRVERMYVGDVVALGGGAAAEFELRRIQ